MHPLFRSLFVLAIFAVPAAHVSTGILWPLFGETVPGFARAVDQGLSLALIRPLGPTGAVFVLLGAGTALAVLSYLNASRSGRPERHQTW